MGRPKKQKPEDGFSKSSDVAETTQTQIETPEEQAPEVIDPVIDETPKAGIDLPEELLETFKSRQDLRVAFVSEGKWFFHKSTAKKHFEQFEEVQNPYA